MISTESPIAKNLQHDIDNFLAWSIENSMTFHPDKCKTMLFGKTDDTSTHNCKSSDIDRLLHQRHWCMGGR